MMKNNRGLTLVELLAAFTISFIILAFVTPIMLQGIKSLDRITAQQDLKNFAELNVKRMQQSLFSTTSKDISLEQNEHEQLLATKDTQYGLSCSTEKCDLILNNEIVNRNEESIIILPSSSLQPIDSTSFLLSLHLKQTKTNQKEQYVSLIRVLDTTNPVVDQHE